MAASMNFRSAFNGFNREDVVHFIEYLNARHAAELNQLNAELDLLRSRSTATEQTPEQNQELTEALSTIEQLKTQLADLQQSYAALNAEKSAASQPGTSQELEAYRRAERTERLARERADQICHQVNGVLADATAKVDEAFAQLDELTNRVSAQLTQLQDAVTGSRQALADASSTLYSIRPGTDIQ